MSKIIMRRDKFVNPEVLLEIDRKEYKNILHPEIEYHRPISNGYLPVEIPYVEEEWRSICSYIPHISPAYKISNYGRIYSEFSGQMLTSYLNNKGYYRVALLGQDNITYQFLVHRLVAICFKYRPDFDKMFVNHINSNRTDNNIWNLEWCTLSENNKHAILVGEKEVLRGEKSPNNVISEYHIRIICKYLSMNYETNDILDKVGLPHNKINQNLISKIYNREIWTSISQHYTFPSKEEKNIQSPRLFDDYLVGEICKRLEKKMKFKDICNELNIEYSDSVRVIIGQIRNGKKFTHVSKNYNIPRDNSLKLTNEQLHKICQGLSDGLSSREIICSIGLQPNDNTRSIFYCIKGRKKHKEISKDYIW